MVRFKRWIALPLTLLLCVSLLAGCAKSEDGGGAADGGTLTPTAALDAKDTPLVVGYSAFSGKFNPFFADTQYDMDVAELTQVSLLTTDRAGGIIYNAIAGETVSYNGTDYFYQGIADIVVERDEIRDTTTYRITLRDDLKFSDGTPLTADDVIFTYYVLADPSYTGSSTLYSYDIVGMQNYRTQTSEAVYEKYERLFEEIAAAGEAADASAYDEGMKAAVLAVIKEEWLADLQAIVAHCEAQYLEAYAQTALGMEPQRLAEEKELLTAFGMAMWGFAEAEEQVLTGSYTKQTWDLSAGEYPSLEDFYEEVYLAYDGDARSYSETETVDGSAVLDVARETFISRYGAKDEQMEGGVSSIAGIQKLSDTVVEVTTNGFEAPAIYSICGISVTPLHYYGDSAQYNYENNQFGFPFGDLSGIKSKMAEPMGAGPYRFVKYENKVVSFEANPHYYKGAPKTRYVQFKETSEADKVAGIGTGSVDISDPAFSKAKAEEIAGYNSNGTVNGNVIVTNTVDNLGYGFIGINSDTVRVGADKASEESKSLRKAFATLFAAYRDVVIDSYFGDAATVIQYPISNTSWAAPQKTDAEYRNAFSVNAAGESIYHSAQSQEEAYEAALQAAIGYFVAAGYTYDETVGKLTAAPEGAKLDYEVIIPAEGQGDHPSYLILTMAREALEKIGITLRIEDPADSNVLWDKVDAGTHEMWCAAWGASIDPDLYQVYFSGNAIGKGGTDSNYYNIEDETLDGLIFAARTSADQAYRKAAYLACLDIILDWAVEVPVYQRQNAIAFSAERVAMESVAQDITSFYDWKREIERLEMR